MSTQKNYFSKVAQRHSYQWNKTGRRECWKVLSPQLWVRLTSLLGAPEEPLIDRARKGRNEGGEFANS